MAIKSSTFGRVELSGADAVRFFQHMNEDKPNPLALTTLARGREINEKTNKLRSTPQIISGIKKALHFHAGL